MNRPPLHSIEQIVGMLRSQAESLARELLPGGKRVGREWTAGGLDGRAGRGVSVCIAGAKQGVWAEFSAGLAGDMLDLIAQCRTGGDKGEALKWARAFLGLSGERAREQRPPPPPAPQRDHEAETARRQVSARRAFLAALPWPGTPVESYLAGRALPREAMRHEPNALRYAPEMWCGERRRPAPAMLGCIVRGGDMIGVHATWIDRGADGVWRKAAIASPKKMLGRKIGGCIPLARGASGLPIGRAPAGDTLAISEGIEDGLSVAIECPDWRVVAALDSGNMPSLALPATITDVVLALQRDGENRAVARAVEAAIDRFTAEGRQVRIARPPEGIKDWNDWRRDLARAAERRNAG